jgi:hypothetical protein
MIRKALTTAVLVAATLAGASEVRAAPSVRLSVAIEDERIILTTGKRGWSHHGKWQHQGFKPRGGYDRGRSYDRGGYDRGGSYNRGGSYGRGKGYHRGGGFVAKRVGRGVVVVRPSYKSFRYQYRPMPLIRNGSFARHPYRW